MRRSALIAILAVGAALLGAPFPASAAGNGLTDAAATPTVVPPGELVWLSVTYEGTSAAIAVSAEAAGLSFPLVRQSGSSTSGTWAAAVTLPVGTWTVVYRATTTHGKSPTLTGPSLTVGQVPGATAVPGQSGADGATAIPISSDPGPAEPLPPAAPADSPPPVAGGSTPGEPPPAAPAENPPAVPPATGDEGAVPAAPPPAAAGTPPQPRADEPAGSTGGSPVVPSPDVGAALPEGPQPSGVPIGIGLVGLAAIAVVAAGLVAAGRERRRLEEAAPPVRQEVAEVLDRRALRQGKTRLEPDPIIAALGVDDAADGDQGPPGEPD